MRYKWRLGFINKDQKIKKGKSRQESDFLSPTAYEIAYSYLLLLVFIKTLPVFSLGHLLQVLLKMSSQKENNYFNSSL